MTRASSQESHVFTINEALRKVPGVFTRDEEGFGLRPNLGIRGLNPTRSSKVLLAWAYIAALDVHRAKVFGLCNHRGGILPFDRLVEQVMSQDPYNQARRVFWIVDNGSAHRGLKSVDRLQGRYANLTLVHSPLHASWLNQIEIYFSILQRKALTPNDFPSLEALRERILGFQQYYEEILKPFEWKFTRKDLNRLMFRMNNKKAECYRLAA